MKEIQILVLSDLHYIGVAEQTCSLKDRKTGLALELLQRTMDAVDIDNIDVILLLGDLVNNGKAPGVKKDMQALAKELKKTGKPVIAVSGNHDISSENLFVVFGGYQGIHDIEGYQFITFDDEYGKDDICFRNMEKMEEVFLGVDTERPIIVLQHNPVHPRIDSPYPYNLQNAHKVMEYYTKKGVALSLSGHAHWGIKSLKSDGVGYSTCPALCEDPFRYMIVTMKEKNYDIKEYRLSYRELGLSDLHIHTHFAYCSVDMDPAQCVKRAEEFGMKRIAFTEHAAQLYVPGEDYWSSNFINDPGIIHKNRNTKFNRMKEYREEIGRFCSNSVLLGLEVEVDCENNLTILEEDRQGWDILLGAVHYLPKKFETGSKKGFMEANEALLQNGVHVLAHPFRYFVRNKLPVPAELYKPLAELLAHYSTAVELNYHTYFTDPDFLKICLEYNIPISLGSDAHEVHQACQLTKHIEFLKQFLSLNEMQKILYDGNSWGKPTKS